LASQGFESIYSVDFCDILFVIIFQNDSREDLFFFIFAVFDLVFNSLLLLFYRLFYFL